MRPLLLLTRRALICFSLLLGVCFSTSSQQHEDGDHTAPQLQPPIKVFDRWGTEFKLEDIRIPQNTELAGMFRLHFEDEYDNTNDGFDDPSLGANRRDILVQVFEDISAMLGGFPATSYPGLSAGTCVLSETFPTCRHIEIQVRKSEFDPNMTWAGRATSYYKVTGRPEMNTGVIWQYINTGWDPWHLYPYGTPTPYGFMPMSGTNPISYGHYHGRVQFNWTLANGYTWNESLTAAPGTNDLDLYTVALHEALHMLGVHSMINDMGLSNLGNTNPGIFTPWDLHLREHGGGTNLIDFDIDGGDCWSPTYQLPNSTVTSNCPGVEFHDAGNSITREVFTATPYNPGSSLSHFNCQHVNGWVMNTTSLGGSAQRFPHASEYKALCALGYDLSGVYGNGSAGVTLLPLSGTGITHNTHSVSYTQGGCSVVRDIAASDDFGPHANDANYTGVGPTWDISTHWRCAMGGNVNLMISDIIANDPGAVTVACAPEILVGGGFLNAITGGWEYHPDPNFFGIAVLRYRSRNNQYQRSNTAYLFVEVEGQPCVFGGNCDENLVCLGDFEDLPPCSNEGFPLNRFGRVGGSPSANTSNTPHRWPVCCNWPSSCPGPNPYNCGNNGNFHCNGATNPITMPNPSVNPSGHNNYGMIAGFVGNNETFVFDLKRPLDNGCHRIEFLAASGCGAEVNFVFSQSEPCDHQMGTPVAGTPQPCNLGSNTGNTYLPLEIQSEVIPASLANSTVSWSHHTITFNSTTIAGAEFLLIHLTTPANTSASNGAAQMAMIDEVQLYDCDQQALDITPTILNPDPCVNDQVQIVYTITNNGNAINSPINFQADISAAAGALSYVAGGGFDGFGLATLTSGLASGASTTLTLTTQLTSSAVVGGNYCIDLVIPSGPCISGAAMQSCVTVGEPTLEITKQEISTGPYSPGSNVIWEVTIENVSQLNPVTGIIMEDALPQELIFVSANGIGGYSSLNHTYTGSTFNLLPGDTRTWTITTMVNPAIMCGPITNCATIAEGVPFCGPNSACGTINVTQTSTVFTATVQEPSCHGKCDGAIIVSPGPVNNTYYSIANPPPCYGPSQSTLNPVLSPLTAGTYTVNIIDAGTGCEQEIQVTVTEPAPIVASISSTPPLCAGDCDAEILITASGGAGGPFVITDLNNNPVPNPWTGLCGNMSYGVNVYDASGCSVTLSTTIWDPASLAVTLTNPIQPETCPQSCDGEINAIISGGTIASTYTWGLYPPGWITPSQTGPSTGPITLPNLCGGVNLLRITDDNGCQLDYHFLVGGPDPMTVQFGVTDETCPGDDDGAITAVVTHGVAPLTYNWAGPGGYTGTGATINSLEPGTYTLTVTDADGCTVVQNAVVNGAVAMSATFSVVKPIECMNDCNGIIQITGSGGVPPYIYTVIQHPNSLPPHSLPGSQILAACPGTYVIQMFDQNNCMVQLPPYVVDNVPQLVAFANPIDPSCAGACDGEPNLIVQGGVPPYVFSMSQTGPWQSNPIDNLCGNAGYTVFVQDDNGCIIDVNFLLQDPDPLAFVSTESDESCPDFCDGSLQVTATGGTPPYTYTVNGGAPQLVPVNLTNQCPNVFNVYVTDANGCTYGLGYDIIAGLQDGWPKEPASTSTNEARAEDLAQVEDTEEYYVTGWFEGTVDFVDDNGGVITLNATGGANDVDAFIAKYGDCGVIWAYGFGSLADDYGYAVRHDPTTGNIFLGGEIGGDWNGYLDLGTGLSILPGVSTTGVPLGVTLGQKGYVMEIDPATGTPGWVWLAGEVFGQPSSVREISILWGNMVVGCDFQGVWQVGGGTPLNSIGGTWDINLVGLNPVNGALNDSYPLATNGDDGCRGLKAYYQHPWLGVAMTGFLNGTGTYGSTPISTNGEDAFVCLFYGHTTFIPSNIITTVGLSGNDRGQDLDLLPYGASQGAMGIYVTGQFEQNITLGGTSYSANGAQDAFVMGLDWNYNVVWGNRGGGPGADDVGLSVSIETGNTPSTVYMAGHTTQGTSGPTGFLSPYSPAGANGDQEMWIVGFDMLTGSPVSNWANGNLGNDDHARIYDIECADNYLYTCGSFDGDYDFGSVTATSQSNTFEAYYARMDYTGTYQPRFAANPPAAEALEVDRLVEVFPNPTTGEFTVRWDFAGARQLEIRDLSGRLIEQVNVTEGTQQHYLNLAPEAQGIYLIRLIADDHVETVRLVKN